MMVISESLMEVSTVYHHLDPIYKKTIEDNEYVPFCRKCMKNISKEELPYVFIITNGIMVDDTFFPEKKVLHYHLNCLKLK